MKSHPEINKVRPDGSIICAHCERWKDSEEFPLAPRMKRGRHTWCRTCLAAYQAARNAARTDEEREAFNERKRAAYDPDQQKSYREANYERINRAERKSQFKRKYGVSLSDYEDQYSKQEGRCLICGSEQSNLVIDHDHRTGRVRGLLCSLCNSGLGMFDDSIEALDKAMKYLSRSEIWADSCYS